MEAAGLRHTGRCPTFHPLPESLFHSTVKTSSVSCRKNSIAVAVEPIVVEESYPQASKIDVYTLCREGRFKDVMDCLDEHEFEADYHVFSWLLKKCGNLKALEEGKLVHWHIVRSSLDHDVFLGSLLVEMYRKCGKVMDARRVFDRIDSRNVIVWTSMIAAYAQHKQSKEAIQLFRDMNIKGVPPNKVTFLNILDACTGLDELAEGKLIHAHVIDRGFGFNDAVGIALINMYGRCGSVDESRHAFGNLKSRNVVAWTSIIAANSRLGHGKQALQLFQQMQIEGVQPDKVTFLTIINACAAIEAIGEGKLTHVYAADYGFECDITIASALVHMYSKCGTLEETERMFNKMHEKNLIAWSVMVAAYARRGYGKEALQLFLEMQEKEMKPDKITFVTILDSCASPPTLELGKVIHARIADHGFESDVVLGTALVNMYGKCGSIEDSLRMFHKMNRRNIISWTAIIAVCTQHGHAKEALHLFHEMRSDGVEPDNISFVAAVDASANLGAISQGKLIHAVVRVSDFMPDITLERTIVDMYGECGQLEDSKIVFDRMQQVNEVSCGVMISSYVQNGNIKEAFKFFQQTYHLGMIPSRTSLVSLLDGCTYPTGLGMGKLINACIIDNALQLDIVVCTALVNMYGQCGPIEGARKIFDKMCEKDIMLWAAMIAVYAYNGYGKEALRLFEEMLLRGGKPNALTFSSALQACASLAALSLGSKLHAQIADDALELDPVVGTTLIYMYGECGSLEEARTMFKKLHESNVVTWNAMMEVYAQYGEGKGALELFTELHLAGVIPDDGFIVNFLTACCCAGMLNEGLHCFLFITGEHGMTPVEEHYGNIVGIFARAVLVEEAKDLIEQAPFQNQGSLPILASQIDTSESFSD